MVIIYYLGSEKLESQAKIKLHKCTDWSAYLLCEYADNGFSDDVANFMTYSPLDLRTGQHRCLLSCQSFCVDHDNCSVFLMKSLSNALLVRISKKSNKHPGIH